MKLPSRPSQHINSTKSIKYFLAELPNEWICRELNQDYGIDFEIEIWEDITPSGKKAIKPTGRVCKIQLKHKEEFDYHNFQVKWSLIQFKVSTINYLHQNPNSFIIVNTNPNVFSVFRVKEIKEILMDIFIKPKGVTVTIPIFNSRPIWTSDNYYYWSEVMPNSEKFFALLSNNKKIIYKSEKSHKIITEKEIPYFKLFNTETDFWKKEAYANIGLYNALKKRNSKIISALKNQFAIEDKWGKLGILEAYTYLNYRDATTQLYAKEIINSDNPLEVILGLYFSVLPNDDSNIDEIDKYYCNPNISEAIYKYNEQNTIVVAVLKSYQIINTEKSLSYLLGSFLSDSYLVKNHIRHLIGSIIKEMTISNTAFSKIALTRFKSERPNLKFSETKKNEIDLFIDHITEELVYSK